MSSTPLQTDKVSECLEGLTDIPRGLKGYRSGCWRAVCRRTASKQALKQCTKDSCRNVCHVVCLGDEPEFGCGNTGRLLALAGITDPMTLYNQRTQETPALSATTDPAKEEPDDLGDLRKKNLVQMIRNLLHRTWPPPNLN